jgi:vacuolar-type H+-ATPase subunit H
LCLDCEETKHQSLLQTKQAKLKHDQELAAVKQEAEQKLAAAKMEAKKVKQEAEQRPAAAKQEAEQAKIQFEQLAEAVKQSSSGRAELLSAATATAVVCIAFVVIAITVYCF